MQSKQNLLMKLIRVCQVKIEDAERILEIFNECGVIGISGYIEDEKEFEELKRICT